MMLPGKVVIFIPPLVVASAWPFSGTETVMVLTSLGGMFVAIIGAWKANAAKEEASQAKLAVNGHLLKLQVEQDKAKKERDMEFERLLQSVKDASRAEGEEIARKAAELLAAKVAEGVARDRDKSLPAPNISHVAVPVVMPASAPGAAPQTRIGEAIVELTAAAVETSESADKTVELAKKHPK